MQFVPPAIALAIGAGLVAAQRQKVSRLEEIAGGLRSQIASTNVANDLTGASDHFRSQSAGEDIEWTKLVKPIVEMKRESGSADMRKILSLRNQLDKMNTQELVAALDRIRALDIDDKARAMMESVLLETLSSKDPGLALMLFSNRIDDDDPMLMGDLLLNSLGDWAEKDLVAATAWLESEIATGTFDTKALNGISIMRAHFEIILIRHLLSVDSKAAADRLAVLPAALRENVLWNHGFPKGGKERLEYANLVRSHLPMNKGIQIFGSEAATISMLGKLENVAGFLDGIESTGEERHNLAEQAAIQHVFSQINSPEAATEKIDAMRLWLESQGSGSVERVTGNSLGQMALRGDGAMFSDALGLVLDYHGRGGGDELITGFMQIADSQGHEEELRELAGKISDPEMRREALIDIK